MLEVGASGILPSNSMFSQVLPLLGSPDWTVRSHIVVRIDSSHTLCWVFESLDFRELRKALGDSNGKHDRYLLKYAVPISLRKARNPPSFCSAL